MFTLRLSKTTEFNTLCDILVVSSLKTMVVNARTVAPTSRHWQLVAA